MVIAIIFLVIALVSAIAVIREFKTQNFLGVTFAGMSTLVFGWFSLMTIFYPIFTSVD